MANTKSAKKAARQSVRRTIVNKSRRSRLRTAVRKVEEAISSGDQAKATAAMADAEPGAHPCSAKRYRAPQRRSAQSFAARASDREARQIAGRCPFQLFQNSTPTNRSRPRAGWRRFCVSRDDDSRGARRHQSVAGLSCDLMNSTTVCCRRRFITSDELGSCLLGATPRDGYVQNLRRIIDCCA